jgi:cytoskeletal protein CcmA (bactofilin family)
MPEEKPKQPAADPQSAPPAPTEPESLDGDSLDAAQQPTSPAAPAGDDEASPQPAKKGLKKFGIFSHLYLLVFALMAVAAVAVVMVSLKSAKPQTKTNKVTSLTSQQLSSLKGNTTLVGDSKQTLDVQSNSIFEGQVLLRSDLNVAGGLKIGGAISTPSITVGGNGTFGQLGINGGLNVGGDTTLQGQLTVQKNLSVTGSASFGSLNVSTLSVTSLQLKGDISLNQHIVATGGLPGRTNGSALGSGGSASISGSDTAGTVNINTGGGPPAGCFVTVNFAKSFGATPHVVITPASSSSAGLQYYVNRTTSNFSICTANSPAASTTYNFDYIVID